MDRVEEVFWQEIMDLRCHYNRKGYAIISARGCPLARANGQMYRCRYVAWAFGKLKHSEDVVHHRDFNKTNDHPDNLEVMSRGAHSRLHTRAMPEVQKEKIRQSLLGRKHDEKRRKAISKGHKGLRVSDEAKRKLSEAHTGRVITWGAKISAALREKGIKPSAGALEASAAKRRGVPLSAVQREASRAGARKRWDAEQPALEARAREWLALRVNGATLRSIAEQYGVSVPTVHRVTATGLAEKGRSHGESDTSATAAEREPKRDDAARLQRLAVGASAGRHAEVRRDHLPVAGWHLDLRVGE